MIRPPSISRRQLIGHSILIEVTGRDHVPPMIPLSDPAPFDRLHPVVMIHRLWDERGRRCRPCRI